MSKYIWEHKRTLKDISIHMYMHYNKQIHIKKFVYTYNAIVYHNITYICMYNCFIISVVVIIILQRMHKIFCCCSDCKNILKYTHTIRKLCVYVCKYVHACEPVCSKDKLKWKVKLFIIIHALFNISNLKSFTCHLKSWTAAYIYAVECSIN